MRQQVSALISMCALCISIAGAAESDVSVSPVMKGSTTISGQRIEYPHSNKPEITAVVIQIQPGKRAVVICTPFRPMYTSSKAP